MLIFSIFFTSFFACSATGKKSDRQTYLPEEELDPVQMAASHGYPAESHIIQTSDGYLLTMHRIPCGRSNNTPRNCGTGQPVLLKHGILSASTTWVMIGPEKGLGYLLADAGYDVWMSNNRGNTYSRRHARLPSDSHEFWNFTNYEMAKYDTPAEIDFIYRFKARTQNDLIFVGYSSATTLLLSFLTMMPEYNRKIKAAFCLAPAVYLTNIRSPLRFLVPFSKNIELMSYLIGPKEFAPQSWLMRLLGLAACGNPITEDAICYNTIFILFGFDRPQLNETLLPAIVSHFPAGVSSRTMVATIRDINRHSQQFDVDKIEVPIELFHSLNDWIAGPEDVNQLYQTLKCHGKDVTKFQVELETFNHVDFIWGIDVKELVYDHVLEKMKKYSTRTP